MTTKDALIHCKKTIAQLKYLDSSGYIDENGEIKKSVRLGETKRYRIDRERKMRRRLAFMRTAEEALQKKPCGRSPAGEAGA